MWGPFLYRFGFWFGLVWGPSGQFAAICWVHVLTPLGYAGGDCDSCGVDGGNKYDVGYVGGDAGSAENGGHGDDSDGSCDDDDDTKDENNECSDVYNRGASFT